MTVPDAAGFITFKLASHWFIEFLKITLFMGVIFIPVSGYMIRKRRFSFPWVASAFVLLAVIGLYGYLLYHLPQRVQIRSIVSEGGALVAEGKFDAAIEEYRKLEALGEIKDMEKYLSTANKEKQAAQDLARSKELISEGKNQEARELLKTVPSNTRAFGEASRLLDGLK